MHRIYTSVAAILLVTAAHAAPEPRITDLHPIPLQPGINHVPDFGTAGREATVSLGWRDNGNAHGYDIALVMMQADRGGPWNIVSVDPAPGQDRQQDTIRDDPHTGEDMVRSFRFVRGKIDEEAAILLLTATRDRSDDGIPASSLVTFNAYRLVHSDENLGTTLDHFALIQHVGSAAKFCNSDMALSRHFGLSLPVGYIGPNTEDGC